MKILTCVSTNNLPHNVVCLSGARERKLLKLRSEYLIDGARAVKKPDRIGGTCPHNGQCED